MEDDDTFLRGRKLIRHRHTDRQTDEQRSIKTRADRQGLDLDRQ